MTDEKLEEFLKTMKRKPKTSDLFEGMVSEHKIKIITLDSLFSNECLLVPSRRIIQNLETGKHEREPLEDWAKRCGKIINI